MSEHAHAHSPDGHGHGHGPGDGHGHEEHHTNYVGVWAVLVVLLIVSVVGPELGHPTITLITAFGIAVVKAYLVLTKFMHVNLEPKLVTYFVAASLAFMFLFFAGVGPDVLKHDGQNWNNVAAKAYTERALKAQHDREAQGGGHGEHGAPAEHGGH